MSPDEERDKFSGDERSLQAKRQLQTSEVRFAPEQLVQEQARQLADQGARITELKAQLAQARRSWEGYDKVKDVLTVLAHKDYDAAKLLLQNFGVTQTRFLLPEQYVDFIAACNKALGVQAEPSRIILLDNPPSGNIASPPA